MGGLPLEARVVVAVLDEPGAAEAAQEFLVSEPGHRLVDVEVIVVGRRG
jgi:hypothetical protein